MGDNTDTASHSLPASEEQQGGLIVHKERPVFKAPAPKTSLLGKDRAFGYYHQCHWHAYTSAASSAVHNQTPLKVLDADERVITFVVGAPGLDKLAAQKRAEAAKQASVLGTYSIHCLHPQDCV